MTLLLPGHVALDEEIHWPAYATFWGLLGEFDLESVSNYAPPHTLDPISTLVPFFLWLYCFIATVILVNLLIAQMSSIYEQVRATPLLAPC